MQTEETALKQVWASVKDGKWHMVDAPVNTLNFTDATTARCGLVFVPFNVTEGPPPTLPRHQCAHCLRRPA